MISLSKIRVITHHFGIPRLNAAKPLCLTLMALVISACSTAPITTPAAHSPNLTRSIMVLPPKNLSPEENAIYTYLSTISRPLAEKGYYVFPVSVIDQFLKENGLPTPDEMHSIGLDKIREHIGADAVLYVTINKWGQQYNVISSAATVSAEMRLVDTHTGKELWKGQAHAKQQNDHSNNGIAGLLVGAIVDQIAGSLTDHSLDLSRQANYRALNHNRPSLRKGPRHPSLSPAVKTKEE